MTRVQDNRMLVERAIGPDGETVRNEAARGRRRAVRSVTVNMIESPLGWLFTRGKLTRRQFDAGEQLRSDWERGGFAPKVTMQWDAAPVGRQRGGSGGRADLLVSQIDARGRFESAVEAAGPGLSDILWRVVCSGEGMREAETALGWPARAGKVVLCLALDRVADFYRIR
ncbi:MAG TPA: DUF6456 domain-containing protein [Sphingomicrobium sp.]|jgi:hypothetical protein|nr:DUF6456 domain-containing protein [Sphingomicrobium sp.]